MKLSSPSKKDTKHILWKELIKKFWKDTKLIPLEFKKWVIADDDTNEEMPNNENKDSIFRTVLIWTFILVLSLWFVMLIIPLFGGERNTWGTFGDQFGGINALFSGLAFTGIVFTIILQGRELKYQRKELSDTREVFERQLFENTFFNLISKHRELIDTFTKSQKKGPEVLKDAAERVKGYLSKNANQLAAVALITATSKAKPGEDITKNKIGDIETIRSYVKEQYLQIYEDFQNELGPYFRGLYNIFKYIKYSNLDNDKKKWYAQILRSEISADEVFLIAANLFSDYGSKFRPLVVEYELTKHRYVNNQQDLGSGSEIINLVFSCYPKSVD